MVTMSDLRLIAKECNKAQERVNYLLALPINKISQGKPLTHEEGIQHWIDSLVATEVRNSLNEKLKLKCQDYAADVISGNAAQW